MRVEGLSVSEVSRRTGIPRRTVGGIIGRSASRASPCFRCIGEGPGDEAKYAYLLGVYLGDGHIACHARGVFRLRVTCTAAYPDLIADCSAAMEAALPGARVGRVLRQGCVDVSSYSKHWPCLLPQHGPGAKHTRPIVLATWQQQIVDRHPEALLRGLVHSDGCRVLNRVGGRAYPRYFFSNASDEIRSIFTAACDQIGVEWRRNTPRTVSIARRTSVARLDEFIGPKH